MRVEVDEDLFVRLKQPLVHLGAVLLEHLVLLVLLLKLYLQLFDLFILRNVGLAKLADGLLELHDRRLGFVDD